MRRLVLICLCMLVLNGLSRPARADVAVSLDPAGSSGANPGADTNHGWEFTVNVPIVVTHLGLFDDDDFDISHPIGLWCLSDSTLLAVGVIFPGTGNLLLDHFRYADVVDVPLTVGDSYVIGSYSLSTNTDLMIYRPGDLQVHSAVTIVGARVRTGGGGLQIPDTLCSDDRFGPSFQFIPEPATLTLLGLESLALLMKRRARCNWTNPGR